jgi:hypothetical protein
VALSGFAPPVAASVSGRDTPAALPPIRGGGSTYGDVTTFAADIVANVPLALADELHRILASRSIEAMLGRRVEQLVNYGHSSTGDLERSPASIVGKALSRIRDAHELLIGNPSPDQTAAALTKIEIAGALLMAGHDRLRAEERG